MKYKLTAFLVVMTISTAYGAQERRQEWSTDGRIQEMKQVQLWKSKLAESRTLEGAEKVDILQLGLRNLGYRKLIEGHASEVDDIYFDIQKAILGVPGHAKHFRDEINQARAKYEEALKGGNESLIGETRQNLAGKLLFEFSTFDHLPSVETVGVLGEYLSDERGYVKMSEHPTLDDLTTDVSGSPVFRRAATALGRLSIVNKPVPASSQFRKPEDVEPWKLWYEQIKAGNRTFRFEGDPQEYDLDGPASKEKIQRVERDRKRDEERSLGHKKSTSGFKTESAITQIIKPSTIAWILAAAGLCAAAVWYFLRGRKVE